jgi:hypothetical protein
MKQRLFLDGINVFCDQLPIHQAVQNTIFIFSYSAASTPAIEDVTIMAAKETVNALFFPFGIQQ